MTSNAYDNLHLASARPQYYLPPKVEIWAAKELESIEGDLSYGGGCFYSTCSQFSSTCTSYSGCSSFNVCSYGSCSYSGGSSEAGSSYSTAYEISQDATKGGTSAMRWYHATVNGAVDVDCSATGAYITVYETFNNVPTNKLDYGSDRLEYLASGRGIHDLYVCIASKNGKPVVHSLTIDTHLDSTDEFKKAGAIWKWKKGVIGTGISPGDVIYLPAGGVDAMISLISHDYALDFIDAMYDELADRAQKITETAMRLGNVPVAALSCLAWAILLTADTPTIEELVSELTTNASQYPYGIRTYRYMDVGYIKRYVFEPWDGFSRLYGVRGSVGEWSAFREDAPQ